MLLFWNNEKVLRRSRWKDILIAEELKESKLRVLKGY